MSNNIELSTNDKVLDILANIDMALVINKKAEEEIESLELTLENDKFFNKEYFLEHLHDIRLMLWGAEDITNKHLDKVRGVLDTQTALGITESDVIENISTINKRFYEQSQELKELKEALNKTLDIVETLRKGV